MSRNKLTLKETMARVDNTPLKEALIAELANDPHWLNSRWFRKYLKETVLQGNITNETPGVDATLELYNQVIIGAEEYVPLDFARRFETDKASFKLPIGTHGTATTISGGVFSENPLTTAFVDVDMSEEFGDTVKWTRAYLEDATWDVLSEENRSVGYAINLNLRDKLITEMETNGTAVGATDPTASWGNFVDFVFKTDIAKYGMSDYVLVTPTKYAALLKLSEFVDNSVMGTDDPIRTGVIRTTLGVTVLKVDGLTYPIALNKQKGIALITRRNITVEPFEYPDTDRYGFTASYRGNVKIMNASAVSVAKA